jgi:hypothetical protein
MQGKEASEQETRKCTAGVDVGKNWLDAHVLPASQSLRVANENEGINPSISIFIFCLTWRI